MNQIELLNAEDWITIKRTLENAVLNTVLVEDNYSDTSLIQAYAKVLKVCRSYEKPKEVVASDEGIALKEQIREAVDTAVEKELGFEGRCDEIKFYESLAMMNNHDLISMHTDYFRHFKLWCDENWVSCLPCLINMDGYRSLQYYAVKYVKVNVTTCITKLIFIQETDDNPPDPMEIHYQYLTTLPLGVQYELNRTLADKARI